MSLHSFTLAIINFSESLAKIRIAKKRWKDSRQRPKTFGFSVIVRHFGTDKTVYDISSQNLRFGDKKNEKENGKNFNDQTRIGCGDRRFGFKRLRE
ncbi:MAG: hypothetical protein Q4E62_03855 [Sutterellaceae bacterium]|nr:hypothetical protein [Sutterellaceae bacterium]